MLVIERWPERRLTQGHDNQGDGKLVHGPGVDEFEVRVGFGHAILQQPAGKFEALLGKH